MIKALLPLVLDLATHRHLTLTFVDVGSRNGILELSDLAGYVDAFGFEPNPEEYQKLVTGRTDLYLVAGVSSPRYRNLRYFPYALGNRCGKSEFYVTPGPGAAGMLEPNLDRLSEIHWKGRTYKVDFAADVFADYRKIEVEVRTLDTLAQEHSIESVDYLKIDVEGSEYEVLEGARRILPHTGVIKVETCFIPFRKGQKLFSHVDLLLREHGFDLLRHEIHPSQVGYKERTTPTQYIPGNWFPDPYGQPLSCDAIYVNRCITDPSRALAQALVLMEKKYLDEALHILRSKANVNDETLFEFLRTFQAYDSTGRKLKALGYQCVDLFAWIATSSLRLFKLAK